MSLSTGEDLRLKSALEAAGEHSFGFVDDFAPDLLAPLQKEAQLDPTDTWQVLEEAKRSEAVVALQRILLAHTQPIEPTSNLDFVHILHRIGGGAAWHYDVHSDDSAVAEYRKGRFRAGFNLAGEVELGFKTPRGERQWRKISPGSLYVMDYSHNPFHGSRPANEASASIEASQVLLLTDIARS